jgi:hypothetical protein
MESRDFTAPDFRVPLGTILLLCSGESPSGSRNVDRALAQTILPVLTILLKFPKYNFFILWSTSWSTIVGPVPDPPRTLRRPSKSPANRNQPDSLPPIYHRYGNTTLKINIFFFLLHRQSGEQ